MNDRAPAPSLTHLLRRAHARVRRAWMARAVLRAAAAAAALLAVAVAAGLALPLSPATARARLALFLGGSLAALALALAGLVRRSPRWTAWLESVEARFPDVRSWLRNALDLEARPPAHTSPELAAALRAETARRLGRVPLAHLAPPLRARAPLAAAGAAAALLVALALLAPRATQRSFRTLWAPELAAPPVTLAVEPGDVTVSPGAALAVHARVAGTGAPPRLLGDGPSPAPALEADGPGGRRWRFDLPPVTRARLYAVRVRQVESPRYRITLTGTPQPVSFAVELRAPAYARLPAQSGTATRGDLAALRGSRARIEVTFDRDLTALTARLPDGRTAAWTAVTPRRWRGEVPVDRDGEWGLAARAAAGAGTFHWRVSALPDQPPVLSVALPAGDVDLPAGQQIPYDLLAQDDLGLTELRLEWRRDAAGAWTPVPLATLRDQPREAHLAARWDASGLGLLPGGSVGFRFVAFDNDRFGRGRAESPEFRLRFPSLNELYASLDDRQERVQETLQKVADQSKELQKSLDEIARQPQRGPSTPQPFERSEEMKRALARQQDLATKLDQATEQLRGSLSDAAERDAFRDELQRKLKEMSELLRQVQSPEFRDAVQKMQDALERLDRHAMEQALPEMQRQNQQMLQNLDRSLALLKQLRDEERTDALSRRAEELKQQQDALDREYAQPPPAPPPDAARGATPPTPPSPAPAAPLAGRQQDAAERTEQLAKDAREAARRTETPEVKQGLEQAAGELEQQAAPRQHAASEAAGSGRPQQAGQSGQEASESLERAAQEMSSSAAAQQRQADAHNLAAVRAAAQDLVALNRSSRDNLQSPASPGEQADAQTDLAEGVARVADSLATLSRQTPFLSPAIAVSLGQAMQGLRNSGRELTQGGRARAEQSGEDASTALNRAVDELRKSESSMCQQPGQGRSGRSSAQQMGELGHQQGQLNERSHDLARRLSQQMRMTAGDQDELRRLADAQARIREQLEQVQRDEDQRRTLLGRLDQTAQEMKRAEEEIRSGDVGDDLAQRQTNILSRLLDAQRSVNRRDYDPQREAHRGEDVAHASPPPLPAAMLKENDRLRLGLLKADADRYPAQYRALIEAYLRSLNGSPR